MNFEYIIDKIDFIDFYLSTREKVIISLNIINAWAKFELILFNFDIILKNILDFELEKKVDDDKNAKKSRLFTFSNLNLINNNDEFVFISFTFNVNETHVNKIVKHVHENFFDDNIKFIIDVLNFNLKFTFVDNSFAKVENTLTKEINVELIKTIKKIIQKKIKQRHVNYNDVKILNQENLNQRTQQRLEMIQNELWNEEMKRTNKLKSKIYAHE